LEKVFLVLLGNSRKPSWSLVEVFDPQGEETTGCIPTQTTRIHIITEKEKKVWFHEENLLAQGHDDVSHRHGAPPLARCFGNKGDPVPFDLHGPHVDPSRSRNVAELPGNHPTAGEPKKRAAVVEDAFPRLVRSDLQVGLDRTPSWLNFGMKG